MCYAHVFPCTCTFFCSLSVLFILKEAIGKCLLLPFCIFFGLSCTFQLSSAQKYSTHTCTCTRYVFFHAYKAECHGFKYHQGSQFFFLKNNSFRQVALCCSVFLLCWVVLSLLFMHNTYFGVWCLCWFNYHGLLTTKFVYQVKMLVVEKHFACTCDSAQPAELQMHM